MVGAGRPPAPGWRRRSRSAGRTSPTRSPATAGPAGRPRAAGARWPAGGPAPGGPRPAAPREPAPGRRSGSGSAPAEYTGPPPPGLQSRPRDLEGRGGPPSPSRAASSRCSVRPGPARALASRAASPNTRCRLVTAGARRPPDVAVPAVAFPGTVLCSPAAAALASTPPSPGCVVQAPCAQQGHSRLVPIRRADPPCLPLCMAHRPGAPGTRIATPPRSCRHAYPARGAPEGPVVLDGDRIASGGGPRRAGATRVRTS